eukprot:scpid94221/ scgid11420/ 
MACLVAGSCTTVLDQIVHFPHLGNQPHSACTAAPTSTGVQASEAVRSKHAVKMCNLCSGLVLVQVLCHIRATDKTPRAGEVRVKLCECRWLVHAGMSLNQNAVVLATTPSSVKES